MPVEGTSRDNLLDTPMPDAIRVSLVVTRILEELGVPYLIGESVASIIHGEPRLTNDIDLVADIREEQIPQLVAALEADFYVDDMAIRRAIRERRQGNDVSEQQRRDALGILKVKADQLDYDYLKNWAARLAVSDLLEKAFDDAGIDPSMPRVSEIDKKESLDT
jgi:hypothetical protein